MAASHAWASPDRVSKAGTSRQRQGQRSLGVAREEEEGEEQRPGWCLEATRGRCSEKEGSSPETLEVSGEEDGDSQGPGDGHRGTDLVD